MRATQVAEQIRVREELANTINLLNPREELVSSLVHAHPSPRAEEPRQLPEKVRHRSLHQSSRANYVSGRAPSPLLSLASLVLPVLSSSPFLSFSSLLRRRRLATTLWIVGLAIDGWEWWNCAFNEVAESGSGLLSPLCFELSGKGLSTKKSYLGNGHVRLDFKD